MMTSDPTMTDHSMYLCSLVEKMTEAVILILT
jgi:hypothetical protein